MCIAFKISAIIFKELAGVKIEKKLYLFFLGKA